METTAKHVSELIHVSKASHATQSTTTQPRPSENQPSGKETWQKDGWQKKWLRLETSHHRKLKDLEDQITIACRNIWRDPARGQLVIIYGENGSGKTHCVKAVHYWISQIGHAKQFITRANHISHLYAIYWRWPELLDKMKSGGWDLIEDLFDAPVLIIDELGGGHDPSGVGTDKLCQVLSRREKRWTFITTNLVQSAWETALDRRIASRFFRNSVCIDLSDVPDFNLAPRAATIPIRSDGTYIKNGQV